MLMILIMLFSSCQDEMTNALATMRVDYDQIKIKNVSESTNPLLQKRRKKEAKQNKK